MQPGDLPQLQSDAKPASAAALRIRELAQIAEQLRYAEMSEEMGERKPLTRRIDACIGWMREHVPALHRAGAMLFATLLFIYCRWVGLTTRMLSAGAGSWPDLPAPGVLALWHGAAPAFLCAIARRRPRAPMAIMVSPDPRGDSLAILCRWMRLQVIRGDRSHGGWEALARISAEVERGACAILTPDGGGPAKFAKPGAVVLAAATGAPLLALGADCTPALAEPNKWDAPRNPLPFGRIAIAMSEPIHIPPVRDGATLDSCRSGLQQALDRAAAMASGALAD